MNAIKRRFFDLCRGLRLHPWRTAISSFAAFSVLWTLTEAVSYLAETDKIRGVWVLAAFIAASVAYGFWLVWKPTKVTIKIADTNSKIEISFGDLFAQEGVRAIAVTEFFDTEIGEPVSERSVHGAFIKKYFGGGVTSLEEQLQQQLAEAAGTQTGKAKGKSVSYPIGTSALVAVGSDRFILFALSKADPKTCKADSSVTMMWVALHGLWKQARIVCGGHPLALPLVGAGLSNIGLPPRDLLNLLILSLITETKEKQITQVIRIVLGMDVYEDLDLRTVKKHWEER
ncbi:hypothetical protein HNR46_000184 [Haloferula luteola]|uniref:Thoeris protein ThsA Macro domain-containing protein n=1 Tax=Haloferula luteola TaxID=595692 RepID=A0A840UYA7_9BACT|nr:macro domain-containing protein [Haloferula luteola]MBB5349963.1 hypothetical protein [Haloferula luteola]